MRKQIGSNCPNKLDTKVSLKLVKAQILAKIGFDDDKVNKTTIFLREINLANTT